MPTTPQSLLWQALLFAVSHADCYLQVVDLAAALLENLLEICFEQACSLAHHGCFVGRMEIQVLKGSAQPCPLGSDLGFWRVSKVAWESWVAPADKHN